MTNKELSITWAKWYTKGKTIAEIAKLANKSTHTIYTWLKKNNVTMRHSKSVAETWRDVPIEKAKELYATGISISEVGRLLGFNKGMVRYALNKNGIKTTKRNNTFTDDEVSVLYEKGNTLEEIADIFGTTRSKVRTSIGFTDTEIRERNPYDMSKKVENITYEPYTLRQGKRNYTKSPSKYAHNSKIFTDENFFNEWSHELSYFLGWMASDGNISESKNAFRITSTDIEHLENLFSLFSYGWITSMRKWNTTNEKNNSPAGTISICRKDIMDKLIAFGILPNKTLIMQMPYIPPKYVRDFVRGVFEGDGSITFKNPTSPNIVIASGSKDFLYGLGKSIEKQTGLKVYVYTDKKGTHRLVYGAPTSVEMMFEYMYKGVPSVLILNRKHKRFTDYLSLKSGGGSVDTDEHSGEEKPSTEEG